MGFLSFLALVAGLYLLGAACNSYLAVAGQKALSCRLVASVSQMDAVLLMQVEKIEGVTGVTEVLEVPGTFQVGKEARAEFTLYGLSPDFLEGRFTKGGAFPESSVMPYVVLNGAAAASATDAEGRSLLGKDQQPDWFQENVEILAGEKAVRVKICGQMQGEEGETPAGYISLSAAKDLLRESGAQPESQTLWIRLDNMGRMESVKKELERQGIFAANADETAGIAWEQQEKESAAYLAAGVLALLSGSVLLGRQLALEPLQHVGGMEVAAEPGMFGKTDRRDWALALAGGAFVCSPVSWPGGGRQPACPDAPGRDGRDLPAGHAPLFPGMVCAFGTANGASLRAYKKVKCGAAALFLALSRLLPGCH